MNSKDDKTGKSSGEEAARKYIEDVLDNYYDTEIQEFTSEIIDKNGKVTGYVKSANVIAVKPGISQKEELMMNQLEYFRRGIEGIDSREVDSYLLNAAGEVIGRPRGDYENFFPEYYVVPVDGSLRKNALEAHKMVEYL